MHRFGTRFVYGCAALIIGSVSNASVVLTDGFGDGDRDNNGTTEVAASNASDTGVPWFWGGGGTSSALLQAVDDSSGIGAGNALQLANSPGQNNRPIAGHFAGSSVTLNDGDSIVLRFDMRVVSNSVTTDRLFRFGLYTDNSTFTSGDRSSTDTSYLDDVGYMARVDVGADASNSTTMDIVRDDSNSVNILGATATSLSPAVQSTTAANQLTDALKHHFELSLTRSGTSMLLSLQEDSNTILTGTDASPGTVGFTFNEVMFTARSNSISDYRLDNIEVSTTAAVPEPAGITTLGVAGIGLLARRRSQSIA